MVVFTNTNGDCDFLVILVSNGGYCFSAVKNDQYDVIVQIPRFSAVNYSTAMDTSTAIV